MNSERSADMIFNEIMELTKEYYTVKHKPQKAFSKGDRIGYSGRVFDEEELINLIDSSLEFYLTAGRYTEAFEKEFADFLGVKYCSLTNSGSSANLLAFMALTSPLLGARRIKKGDEVISVAAGFPTSITPILQFGAVPVFVDVTLPGCNLDVTMLDKAISEKTKCVFAAHTMGSPFDLSAVKAFCEKNNLWLIEDNCDSLGTRIKIGNEWKYTGTIGDIGTSSFYPPHHITMGEGGAVYTNNPQLHRIINSFRDWGRDCYCKTGEDNSCNNRFNQQFGELPFGYDHKYVYSHFGYNLKATDMQAAIGLAQLKKLPSFIEARKRNWEYLKNGLMSLSDRLLLPETEENSDPSWFGFLMTIKDKTNRLDLVTFLENKKIQTRALFAGNFLRHPCFNGLRDSEGIYRTIGNLPVTDKIMNDTFWIGVYPGIKREQLDYMIESIHDFYKEKNKDTEVL